MSNKKCYLIVESSEDGNAEVIASYETSLKEAQKKVRDEQTIYEVSRIWEARPAMEIDEKDLSDVFGV